MPPLALWLAIDESPFDRDHLLDQRTSGLEFAALPQKLRNLVQAPRYIDHRPHVVRIVAIDRSVDLKLLEESLSRALAILQVAQGVAEMVEREREVTFGLDVAGGSIDQLATPTNELLIETRAASSWRNRTLTFASLSKIAASARMRVELPGKRTIKRC